MNLEMSERMTARLVTQGYKPVDEPLDPKVVIRLGRDLHELSRDLAALHQLVEDGQAAPVASAREALTPLVTEVARLTALCQHALHRLEALAESCQQSEAQLVAVAVRLRGSVRPG
jgi:hypothetical protein